MSTIPNDSWLTAGIRQVMGAAPVSSSPSAGDSGNTELQLQILALIWDVNRLLQANPPDMQAVQADYEQMENYENGYQAQLGPDVQAMLTGAADMLYAILQGGAKITGYAGYIENSVAAQTVQWMGNNKEQLQTLMAPGASNQDIYEFTSIMMGLSTTKNGQGATNIDSFFAELSNPPTPMMLLDYFYTQDGGNMTQAIADLKAYASTLPQPPPGVNAPNYEKLLQEITWTINNPPDPQHLSYYMQQEDAAIEKWLNS